MLININIKMPTNVGILIFLSMINFKFKGFESSQFFNLHIFASGIFGYLLNGKTTCIFDNYSFMNRNKLLF